MMTTSLRTNGDVVATSQPQPNVQQERTWEVLDLLIRQLQSCRHAAEQVGLALQAVRDLTGADVAFWYPGSSGGAVSAVGHPWLAPAPPGRDACSRPGALEWCRAFAARQLEGGPEAGSRLVWSAWPSQPGDWPLDPSSVAMVRVSQPRSIWMVAVSFDPNRHFGAAEVRLMSLVRRLLVGQRRHSRDRDKLRSALLELVHSLVAAINAKSPFTFGHSERVARIALRIGQQMGLSSACLGGLYLAGLLHDVGKIGIRTSVLQQTGPLSPEDREHIQQHTVIGDAILAGVRSLAHLRPAVRNHHERHDGTGYPDRLAGSAIPLLARILAVADACDAMVSGRPYRGAISTEQVDAILAEGAGSQWDPVVVNHFMACRQEVYAVRQKDPRRAEMPAAGPAPLCGDSVQQAIREVIRGWDEE
jgi:HD-GYP domain-containing protein (c-di-GMP phosphodiesterase class II)